MEQKGFSKFSWALALFCLPCAFWPLALLVLPKFSGHSTLTASQASLFSTAFGLYPFVLFVLAGILFKIHKTHKSLAGFLLLLGFIMFYILFFYVWKLSF